MAKTDNWQRRRRSEKGFDEFAPTPDLPPLPSFSRPPPRPMAQATAAGPESTAVVKWFNAEKGFGFVEMTEGTGDVFLHASVLTRMGVTAVNPGATLKVRTGQGQKGPQVTEVTEVDESTAGSARAAPRFPRAAQDGGPRTASPARRSGGGGRRLRFWRLRDAVSTRLQAERA